MSLESGISTVGHVQQVTLLTLREAAKALRVCEKTVTNWVSRGELAKVQIGRRVLYDPSDLRAFIERRKVCGVVG